MNITELIGWLAWLHLEHGDLPCFILRYNGCGNVYEPLNKNDIFLAHACESLGREKNAIYFE